MNSERQTGGTKQLIELNIILFNFTQAQKLLGTEAKELTPELKQFLQENSHRLRSSLEYSEQFLKNAELTRDLNPSKN